MSPATMPWPSAPMVTAASPVSTPARASERLVARATETRRDELQGGADRALGVVLVGGGRSPHRHHRVADELLDRAAVPLDDPPRQLEVAGQQLARLLGVALLGEGREADQVGEQDRHQPALGHRLRRGLGARVPGSAAAAALPLPGWCRTRHRTSRPAGSRCRTPGRRLPGAARTDAELPAGFVLRVAVGAGQQGRGASIGSVRLIRRCSIRPGAPWVASSK